MNDYEDYVNEEVRELNDQERRAMEEFDQDYHNFLPQGNDE